MQNEAQVIVKKDAQDCSGIVYVGRDLQIRSNSPGLEFVRKRLLKKVKAGEYEIRDVPHAKACGCIK